MYPDAEQFGRDVGPLGISNADTVVVYDAGGWVAAPRAWWMFLAFGHSNVTRSQWRPEEVARRGPSGRERRGKAEAREFRASYDPNACAACSS